MYNFTANSLKDTQQKLRESIERASKKLAEIIDNEIMESIKNGNQPTKPA